MCKKSALQKEALVVQMEQQQPCTCNGCLHKNAARCNISKQGAGPGSKSLWPSHIQAAVAPLPRGLKSYSLPVSHQCTNAEGKNIIIIKKTQQLPPVNLCSSKGAVQTNLTENLHTGEANNLQTTKTPLRTRAHFESMVTWT